MPRRASSASSAAFSARFCALIGLTPAEVAIVVRDLLESLVGDAAAARHVAQERDDVVLPLGPAEAGQQDRVVGDRHLDVRGAGRRGIRGERDTRPVSSKSSVVSFVLLSAMRSSSHPDDRLDMMVSSCH